MIYIAAPFFNQYQIEVVEKIKYLLDELGLKYFSPKDVNPNVEDNKSSPDLKNKVFIDNVVGMQDSDLAIAVIDDFDKGTIWEMGYLYAKGKGIIGYTEFQGRGMNIMLSQSVIGFCHGIDELRESLKEYGS